MQQARRTRPNNEADHLKGRIAEALVEGMFEEATPWPELYLVLVTDNPEPGRSCFQAIDVADENARTPQDVDKVRAFDIYPSTVREYEHLVTKLFPLFDKR